MQQEKPKIEGIKLVWNAIIVIIEKEVYHAYSDKCSVQYNTNISNLDIKCNHYVCIQAKWPIRPQLIVVAWSSSQYFYFPLDGMLVHSRINPQHYVHQYSFIHLNGERHFESKVSCPKTQHNVPGQGSNSNYSIWSQVL